MKKSKEWAKIGQKLNCHNIILESFISKSITKQSYVLKFATLCHLKKKQIAE